MRRFEIEFRAFRHDAERIDVQVRFEIVALDMLHVDGPGHTRHLVDIPRISPQIRVIDNAPDVAFEMRYIDRIETHQRCDHPTVRLGKLVADKETRLGKNRLDPIKCREQLLDGAGICSLLAREASAIDAVINFGVNPLIAFIDFFTQWLRTEFDLWTPCYVLKF